MQRGYILTHPLSRSVTACHSLSPPLIHKQQMCPHTRPQPPSLLDLLSYPRTPRGFPPSGDSFHVNTTSNCGAALSLRTSIHRRAAYLSHLRGGKNKQCLYPSCISRSDRLRLAVFAGPYTPRRRRLDHSTVCADEYSICPAAAFLSNTLPSP